MLNRISILTLIVLGTAALATPPTANAQTTWYVDDDAPNDPGPGDPTVSDPLEDGSPEHPFDAIQEGIDAATDGDTVLVADGTYRGTGNRDLDFGGRLITLCSVSEDPALCVIDCEEDGRGFYFHSGETHGAIVRGLTITRGFAGGDGGGVLCESYSAPTISWCVVIDNWVAGNGGGIYCHESSPAITNCRIARNIAFAGGGICCHDGSSPAIVNCLIERNATLAGLYVGGGLRCNWGSSPTVTNCTIVENVSHRGPGDGVGCLNDSVPTITDCILWGNGTEQIYAGGGNLAVTYCDVQGGWPGAGNIDSDPLLTADGLHLQASSPCRDAGDPNGVYTGQSDVDGEIRESDDRVDMGVDEYIDVDADALPDWWESLYFGSPTGGDPTADIDADGRTTAQEYVLSTNPVLPPMTYYASVAGDDSWDGLAPQWDGQHGPKATIQAALDATHPLEGDTVVVADGTYVGDGNHDLDFHGKAILVCSENGPDSCIIDCEASGRGFDFHSHEDETSILQGFTIRNGSAGQGAGIYSGYSSNPTIINCTLTANTSTGRGAGIYCHWNSPTLRNCIITSNAAAHAGGGIYCHESGPTISGCEITDNISSDYGGGIGMRSFSSSECLTISDCAITGNQAGDDGGGLGGDAYFADVIVQNSMITDNSANGRGGGLDLGANIAIVTDCVIERNHAWNGGGVEGRANPLFLVNCDISDNVALEQGGGIECVFTDNYHIINCDIIGNITSGRGGGIYCGDNTCIVGCTIVANIAYSEGGGISCSGGTSTVANCTMAANVASAAGGAVYCRNGGNVTVASSILWGNAPEEVHVESGGALIRYCDVLAGWPGEGNIDADPLFVDPDGPDDDPNTWEDNDYRLSPGSPCIDAGDNTAVPLDTLDLDNDGDTDERIPFDLDGNPRFVQDPFTEDSGVPDPPLYRFIVDMGAYEYEFCFGDLDDDDDIDLADLAQLLGNYGETAGMTYYDGDLDGDGDVDLADLAELLGAYGDVCS